MRIKSLTRLGRNFFSRAVISLVLVAGFWVGLSATPLPPPLFCVDDETCVESPTSAPPPVSGDGYTLANATAGLPFTLNLPIPPTITSEVTVTPATIAANIVNGRRLILQPGNYGSQNFDTQDQEIVIQPGVEIATLGIGRDARRLHFRASPARSGRIRNVSTGGSWQNPISDVLFDGILADDTGTPGQNQFHGTRVAVINSSITASAYAMANFHQITDFILANSHVHTYGTTQSNMRSHGALRYVVVDSWLQKTGGGHHTLRVHAMEGSGRPADYIYIARNQFDGARVTVRGSGNSPEDGGAAESSSGIGTVWFENNAIYNPWEGSSSLYVGGSSPEADQAQMMYMRNNVLYSDYTNWFGPSQPRANWVLENNPVNSYQTAPGWDFR
jgi:hypothetical protein